jgi:hypothetical protein
MLADGESQFGRKIEEVTGAICYWPGKHPGRRYRRHFGFDENCNSRELVVGGTCC